MTGKKILESKDLQFLRKQLGTSLVRTRIISNLNRTYILQCVQDVIKLYKRDFKINEKILEISKSVTTKTRWSNNLETKRF